MSATRVLTIDKDYFYRTKKDGSKKITYTIKDEEKTQVFLDSCLKSINIKVADRWYLADYMPTIKAFIGKNFNDVEDRMEFKTVEYDLTPLRNLKMRDVIDVLRVEHLSENVVYYHYEKACSQFKYTLSRMSLADLDFNSVERIEDADELLTKSDS